MFGGQADDRRTMVTGRPVIITVLIMSILTAAGLSAADTNPHNGGPCLLCHRETPRFGVDTRETVTFRKTSADDPALCSHCHKPEENPHPLLVEPGPEAAATRRPSRLPLGESPGFREKVVCITCHSIHTADSVHALLRGFEGTRQPDLFSTRQDFCRECHGDNLERRSPHDGDDRACTFCHQEKPGEGLPWRRGYALCNFCHGGLQDGHFRKANPFQAPVVCVDCHDPHLGSDHPARLKKEYLRAVEKAVAISPHYRKSLCFTCHMEGEGYSLRDEDPVSLCNRCHGTGEVVGDIHPLRKIPDTISIPEGWPTRDGSLTCLTCHYAGHHEHKDTYKFLRGAPRRDKNDFCLNCHGPDACRE